ncbi:hypothetical protein NQZ68_036162 [Dissostichus eleginoides]|nr:hypothetical protein NQZ68_036162 [Dissostichus eleginoides]
MGTRASQRGGWRHGSHGGRFKPGGDEMRWDPTPQKPQPQKGSGPESQSKPPLSVWALWGGGPGPGWALGRDLQCPILHHIDSSCELIPLVSPGAPQLNQCHWPDHVTCTANSIWRYHSRDDTTRDTQVYQREHDAEHSCKAVMSSVVMLLVSVQCARAAVLREATADPEGCFSPCMCPSACTSGMQHPLRMSPSPSHESPTTTSLPVIAAHLPGSPRLPVCLPACFRTKEASQLY